LTERKAVLTMGRKHGFVARSGYMAVVSVLLGGVLAAPHAQASRRADAPNPSPMSTPTAGAGCVQLKEDHVVALRPDNTETKATAGDGFGRRHYFRTQEGGLMPLVTVPADFDPEGASPEALRTYGYPDRPDRSSANRAGWDKSWGMRSKLNDAKVGYCEAHEYRQLTAIPFS
jgi:hypothetical protein